MTTSRPNDINVDTSADDFATNLPSAEGGRPMIRSLTDSIARWIDLAPTDKDAAIRYDSVRDIACDEGWLAHSLVLPSDHSNSRQHYETPGFIAHRHLETEEYVEHDCCGCIRVEITAGIAKLVCNECGAELGEGPMVGG